MNKLNFQVIVRGMWLESPHVICIELVAADGTRLPDFVAGAHVDVHLPNGHLRSYSLISRGADGLGYRIGVKREEASRGGSAWLHDIARLGMQLRITAPKGDFELVEDAPASVFIAGGIGITPLLPMMARLNELGRPWQLHYAASRPSEMAFKSLIKDFAAHGGQVHTYFSESSKQPMDIEALVRGTDEQAHLYCCGPARMIDAYMRACAGRAPVTVHFERFAAEQAAATEGGFTLELARTGRSFEVPGGKTILDVLLDAGVDIPYSCGQGVCGSCQTRVLDGEPDHRDCFLTESERAANDSILVCCSGARSARLVLDL